MSEEMYSNLDEAINFIATELAKSAVGYNEESKENSDKNQELLKNLMASIQENKILVGQKIDAICNDFLRENPNAETGKNFRLGIVNYISKRVADKSMVNIGELSLDPKMVQNILGKTEPDVNKKDSKSNIFDEIEFISNNFIFTEDEFEKYEEDMKTFFGDDYIDEDTFDAALEKIAELYEAFGEERMQEIIDAANKGDVEAAEEKMIQDAIVREITHQNLKRSNTTSDKKISIEESDAGDINRSLIALLQIQLDRGKTINDSEVESLVEAIKVDLYETNPQGERVLSNSKIQFLIKKHGIDVDFFKRGYTETAEMYISDEKCQYNSAEESVIEANIEAGQQLLRKSYRILEKLDRGTKKFELAMDEFLKIAKQNPDSALRFVEEIVTTNWMRNTSEGKEEKEEQELAWALSSKLIEIVQEAKETGYFIEDEYTMATKKSIFKEALEIGSINNLENCTTFFKTAAKTNMELLKTTFNSYLGNQTVTPNVVMYIKSVEGIIQDEDKQDERLINNNMNSNGINFYKPDDDEPSL